MISLILTIALVGLIVWLVTNYIPMPEPFKRAIVVIVIVFVILWLIQILGIGDVAVPRLHRL